MPKTYPQSDQIVNEIALSQLGSPARQELDDTLAAINQNFQAPLKLSAAFPTPDAKLYFLASEIEAADGTGKSVPPVSNSIQAFPATTIDFQTGAVVGGTVNITFPSSTVGQFRRCAFSYSAGALTATFSAEAASLGALVDPGTLFSAGLPVGWIDLECTNSSGQFKTAGSATNIIENKVSGASRIHNFGAGGGAGGGSGSGRITSWSTISSNTTLAPSTGYIVDSATDVVLTLPTHFAVGDTIIVIGKGAGLWSIKTNTGQTIRYLSERVSGTVELTASSSDDAIELNGISTNTEMSVVQFTGTPYANINYFGDGSDGALSTAGDETITSTSDGDMIVKNYTSLTINSGHTMTVSNRCKGLLIYVDGDCTIDGTLTMTARGANVDASTAGVSASGLRIKRFKSGSSDSDPGTNLLSGCGAAAIAAENNQESIAGFGKVYTIPRTGGSGAGAPTPTNMDEYRNGNTGGTTSGGSGGGGSGGNGHANASGLTQAGVGGAGTCFSGGAGGGGAFANNSSGSGGAGANNGGAGGNGFNGGGGAGNPGGSGSHTGGNGTGGLLILIVRGNLTIGASGVVSANGTAGGSGDNASRGSGGGSGGGIILMLHGGTYTNNGTVQANGGAGGSNVFTTGGSGGAGSVTVDQIDQ